jgi:hypothetical protein
VIDDEHVDYGSLRLHAKAELFEYVEQGGAVGIVDTVIAALRSAIQTGRLDVHRRPVFGLEVVETSELGLVEEWSQ